jgi:protein O-mannosyl-transferase
MLFLRIRFSGKKQYDGFMFMRLIEQKKYSVFLILFITFAVYANTLQNEFTNWDDGPLIVNKKEIRSLGFENIKKIFDYKASGTYQPVRVFSYAIDYHFWGLNPVGYHIHNILLHAMAAVFLYLSLLKVIPQIRGMELLDNKAIQYTALFTALFFAVHPVNVEAVTWLSGRKYVLLSFFSFLSFYLFVKNSMAERYSIWLSGGSLLTAIFAVFSSPFGVVLPVIFFLYDYCRDESNNPLIVMKKRVIHYLPYLIFVLLAVPKLWTVLVIGSSKEHYQGNAVYTLWCMLKVIFDYVRNLIFPVWLSTRYTDYVALNMIDYKIIISLAGLIILSGWIIWQMKKARKNLLFCAGWVFIFWLPVSNIIPLSIKMADRYIYIAAVGFFLWVVFALFNHFNANKRNIVNICIVSLLIVCAVLSIQRNRTWKNSITLWEDSLKKDPLNVLALTNLGGAYFYKEKYKDAIRFYHRAAVLKPLHFAVHNNLGAAYMKNGQLKKAEAEYLKDIQINPDRLLSYKMLAKIYEEQGDNRNALKFFKKGAKISDGDAELHYDLASLYAAEGDYESAILNFRKAVEIKSDYPEAYYDMGRVFHNINRLDKAEEYYLKALGLKNDYPEPYNSLGNVMLAKGAYDKAEEYYNKALEIRPEYPEVYYNMGNGYVMRNDLETALEYFMQALHFNPGYSAAQQMINKIEQVLNDRSSKKE